MTAPDYLTVKGSATVKISKADQDAPAGLVGNNWTTCNSKDGSISGVTKAMEYRRGSSGDYQKTTSDDKLTGLAKSGTYYVRYAEDGNHNASADAEVKIEPDPMLLPTMQLGSRMAKVATLRSASIARRLRSASPAGGNMRSLRPPRLRPMVFVKRSGRVCNGRWDEERYTYVDTYAPTIYDLWVDKAYCESVSFDVFDDRDETVTVTDSGKELQGW